MKKAVSVSVLVLLLSCHTSPVGFLDIDGWVPIGEPRTYGPDTLWEFINGAADTFLSSGFELLTVQNYQADGVTVTVSCYDMGTLLNAFGIYRTEAPADVPVELIGVEAVLSPPYQALLLKDRFYVKLDAFEGEIDESAGRALLEAAARALPGSGDLPPEFAALPTEGMVAGSARYTSQDLFGLAELDGCAHAAYRDEAGSEYAAFVVLPPEGGTVEAVWRDLEGRWQGVDLDGVAALYREVPYSGLVGVVKDDAGLLGVSECADLDQLRERIGPLKGE